MTGSPAARRYKGFTPKMGVYRITHLPSGRSLLGWSPHVEGMLNRIRFQLDRRVSPRAALQRDWNEGGPEAFHFEVLDELAPGHPDEDPTDDLKELLSLWEERLALPPEQRY